MKIYEDDFNSQQSVTTHVIRIYLIVNVFKLEVDHGKQNFESCMGESTGTHPPDIFSGNTIVQLQHVTGILAIRKNDRNVNIMDIICH